MEDSGTSESGSAYQEGSKEEVAVNWVLEYWLGIGGGEGRCFRLRTRWREGVRGRKGRSVWG